jgi:hypothetical protein
LGAFTKINRENPDLVKIWQKKKRGGEDVHDAAFFFIVTCDIELLPSTEMVLGC